MDSRQRSVIVGVAPDRLVGLTGVSWFGAADATEHVRVTALVLVHPGDPAGATGLSCQTPRRLIKSGGQQVSRRSRLAVIRPEEGGLGEDGAPPCPHREV